MSRYTQTIKSMLMENIQTGEKLSDLSDMLAISKRAIFDETIPMNVIDSDYRDRLILGFTLHYLNDEIGLETPILFKFGLAEKIYNNSEYINGIFDKLDKQVLSDYRTKSVSGTSHDVITDAGTIANTGTVETAKDGSDTTKHTGQDTDSHLGTNTVHEHIDDILTKSGSEISGRGTTDTTTKRGSYTTTDNSNVKDHTETDSSNNKNSGSYGLDTPQDNIGNLRSANATGTLPYDARGKGILAASESYMNYMTTASLGDSTDVNHEETTTTHEGQGGTVVETPNTTDTLTRTGADTLSFNNRKDDKDYTSDTTYTYNESNTHQHNTQDKVEYGSTDTRTDDTLMTKDLETTKDGTTGSSETEQNLNMEMLYRSIPLLSVLWNMFDELFMSIY